MSGTGNMSAVIPVPEAAIADEGGRVTIPWRAWFLVLQRRTGGNVGIATGDLAGLVALERAARLAADDALRIAIDAEIDARIAADALETAARVAGDQTLTGAIRIETFRALTAEARLVPIAQLCSMWAGCDLSFLPTTDPGNGMPWLDGNHIAVGTPAIAIVAITLETGTGSWLLENGTGPWQWG